MPSRGIAFPFVLALAGLVVARSATADSLEFLDGHRVHGRLVSVTRGWVEFQPLAGDDRAEALRVAVAEVRAIRFDDDPEGADVTIGDTAGGGDRTDADAPRGGRMLTVAAAERWTDTAIDVVSGDVVSFSVAGTVTLGDDRPLGAEGDPDGAAAAPRRPLPDRPAGALVGRIGTSPDDTFFIGAERLPFRVRTTGRLYLSINDDTLADDTGAFQVAITR
jgi:hypothetical protein